LIEAGATAPDFTLADQDGNEVSLADFRGSRVVLVFYPSDFSPVCTDQLRVYQDVLGDFERRGARLIGISVDNAFCHKAFQSHLDIEIPLLADFHPKGDVARAYGVWSEEYGVSSRALVLVGPEGDVEWTYRRSPLEIPPPEVIFEALDGQAAAQTRC
jgi:peroxiredoxin